jgi:hypothetical protein
MNQSAAQPVDEPDSSHPHAAIYGKISAKKLIGSLDSTSGWGMVWFRFEQKSDE